VYVPRTLQETDAQLTGPPNIAASLAMVSNKLRRAAGPTIGVTYLLRVI